MRPEHLLLSDDSPDCAQGVFIMYLNIQNPKINYKSYNSIHLYSILLILSHPAVSAVSIAINTLYPTSFQVFTSANGLRSPTLVSSIRSTPAPTTMNGYTKLLKVFQTLHLKLSICFVVRLNTAKTINLIFGFFKSLHDTTKGHTPRG